jgi:hypothetical protein
MDRGTTLALFVLPALAAVCAVCFAAAAALLLWAVFTAG